MFKRKYSDEQLIEDIRSGGPARERAWEYIYKMWSRDIYRVIIKAGGTKEEAFDAFQAAYEGFEARIRKADFELKSRLSSYLTTCVFNEFLRQKKKEGKIKLIEFDEKNPDVSRFDEWDLRPYEPGLKAAVLKSLGKLGRRCRAILLLFYYCNLSMQKIAEKMGFLGGEQVAKNEKRKCMARYEDYLRKHPGIAAYLKNLRHG